MTGKKIRKMNFLPKQKMEDTYCVNCRKYTGDSHTGSETINSKVKLLKTKCLKSEHDKSMFLKQIHN